MHLFLKQDFGFNVGGGYEDYRCSDSKCNDCDSLWEISIDFHLPLAIVILIFDN